MRFIADFHIHSHLSRATSKQLAPEYLDLWARLKGISVIGTGDFTHPDWLKELQEKLEPAEEGLFRLKPAYRQRAVVPRPPTLCQETRFVLQAEISSIYKKDGRTRKVHNVILAPDFETVEKIRQSLLHMNANLTSDGRPILGLDSHDLLEISLGASERIAFIPAHIWTPWFSILGSKSGFDTVEECFEDLTPHLTAMETGLSTDAPMHWTCTFLDPFTLISNSDAHSPEKLGRNANIFDTELSYPAMISALKEGDQKAFLGTIDLFPQEGKYHYDGHRKCKVVWNPLETLHHNGICPVCGKKVTVGVMHRVAQLADRDDLESRPNRLPFVSIIPLKEILSEIFEVGAASKRVDIEYHTLLRRFGPELYILLDLPVIELIKGGKPLVGEALRRMRERRVIIQEGYDGEYGVIRVFKEGEARSVTVQQALFSSTAADSSVPQRRLINFDLKMYQDLYAQQRGSEPEQLAFEAPAVEIKRKPLLSGLNSEQQRAARHSTGPALILAGPGTGKTRTLTYRIAHLIQDQGVAPESILAVTFTNKAASEIGQRLNELLPGEGQEHKPRVSTFHAFGFSALKEHADAFGRSGSFSLVDVSDKRHVLGKSLGCPRQEISKVLDDITRAKQELTPLSSDPGGSASPFWGPYEEYCRENDLFDLDDCIYRPVRLFLEHPEVRKDFQGRFSWILIDEYQDINLAQYRLVRLLLPGPVPNLCVIGDPDQAIYGFRGADVRIIQEFLQDYPEAAVFRLKQSYRCTDTILRASSRVIALSIEPEGFLQGLQEGVKITIAPQATDRSEAEFVARTIEDLMGGLRFFSLDSDLTAGESHTDLRSLSDFAVLCRVKDQMKALERAFQNHSIPYQSIGETPFFQQEPAKSVVDVFRLAANPGNPLLRNRLFGQVLPDPNALESLSELIRSKSVSDSLAAISTAYFQKERDASLTEFNRLQDMAREFGTDGAAFLKFMALGTGADTFRRRLESVSLMTLHASKGLEFRCVFIVGCEDGLLPYSLFDRLSDREEEKRLLYVGMTRAKKYLLLSHAGKRFLLGREYRLNRSPFLDRIEEELLEQAEAPLPVRKKDNQGKLF
ncbi:MAG: UvrD-helicase domain-containing protein [Candidatus Aminicenantaceae bacterium]